MNQPLDRKIVPVERLAEWLARQRADGRTVVQCHGCFDIVHPGHVRYLQFARQLGDVLIVSLTGDAGVNKGSDRPYIPQELRAENLAALEFVDRVVVDGNATACELLEMLRPDIYVKGHEYAHATDSRFLREREVVERNGGRVVFHSGDVVFSSTRLIESIERDPLLEECRLRTTCERADIRPETLRAVLDGVQDLRVLVVGDLLCERYVLCDPNPPNSPSPLLALQEIGVREYWGGAAAVAQHVQALGAEPYLVTSIGSDASAEALCARFAETGIPSTLLAKRSSPIVRTTFVADDNRVMELTSGQAAPIDTAAEREARDALLSQLPNVDVVLWCDLGYGMVTPVLTEAVARAARREELVVAGYGGGPRGDLHRLAGCDLLSTTERRLREATQDMSSGLSSAAYHLLASLHTPAAVVSIHKRGLVAFDGRPDDPPEPDGRMARLRSDFVPSFASHYVDLLGADEAVFATGALAFAGARSVTLAAYLAAAAEAVVVGRPGGRALALPELHALLSSRPELWTDSRFVAGEQAEPPDRDEPLPRSATPDATAASAEG